MLSVRWRSQAGVAAFLGVLMALAVLSVLLRPERATPKFRIEFPDAAFVVEEGWVMPNQRALNFTDYDVQVPLARVPVAVQALMSAREREMHRRELTGDQILHLNVNYSTSPKPEAQFRRLLDVEGWKPLPDTNPDFRIAEHEDSRPYKTARVEAYEVKSDTRYVIFCSINYAGDRSTPWKSCGVTVPYHAQCANEKCTRLQVDLAPSQITRWAEIAEQIRSVLRPLEAKPDSAHWQRLEQMQREAASWYKPLQPQPGK